MGSPTGFGQSKYGGSCLLTFSNHLFFPIFVRLRSTFADTRFPPGRRRRRRSTKLNTGQRPITGVFRNPILCCKRRTSEATCGLEDHRCIRRHSRTGRNLPFAVPVQLETSDADGNRHPFHEEQSWRCLAHAENEKTSHAGILVSRWIGTNAICRHENAGSSSGRHIIGVALKATQVKLTRGSSTLFDGPMPAGTLHVTGPSQPLTAEFRAPCDFVHFHVSSGYLHECQAATRSSQANSIRELNDLIVRDPLAELLGKTLVESGTVGDSVYVESVAQTLVMHVARLELPRHSVNSAAQVADKASPRLCQHASRKVHHSRRFCQGGRTLAHAFRGAVPGSNRIPPP